MPDHSLLYDADCGFCRWSAARVLARDRERRLRPVALQSPEADAILAGMDHEKRMASFHLGTPDGRVLSAGPATAPLLRLLPGGAPLAALAERFPRAVSSGYWAVVRHRDRFGALVTAGAAARARGLIERRAA